MVRPGSLVTGRSRRAPVLLGEKAKSSPGERTRQTRYWNVGPGHAPRGRNQVSIPVYDALAKARGRGTTVALVTIDKVVGDVGVSAGAQLVVDDDHVVAGDFGVEALNTAGTELAVQALVAGENQVAQWSCGDSDRK